MNPSDDSAQTQDAPPVSLLVTLEPGLDQTHLESLAKAMLTMPGTQEAFLVALNPGKGMTITDLELDDPREQMLFTTAQAARAAAQQGGSAMSSGVDDGASESGGEGVGSAQGADPARAATGNLPLSAEDYREVRDQIGESGWLPTIEQVDQLLANERPLVGQIVSWGVSDTVVREDLYELVMQHLVGHGYDGARGSEVDVDAAMHEEIRRRGYPRTMSLIMQQEPPEGGQLHDKTVRGLQAYIKGSFGLELSGDDVQRLFADDSKRERGIIKRFDFECSEMTPFLHSYIERCVQGQSPSG